MSVSIDDRVVSMRFNNKEFEANADISLKTLDKLHEKLDFKNAGQGLETISAAANRISFSGLTDQVGVVEAKFSAMSIAAATAISNITNSAINAGKHLVNSLSLDQITAGFSKYEQKTQSVQTIMNATGKSVDEVNERLDKLMWYTDETSYNFIDMTSNIGKFTNNSVDLDVAITAMEGISNWAASVGANTNEASRAMYNLSQAISVGSVKLMDWRSIENANMADAKFKEKVIENAVAMNTLTKAGDGIYKTMKGNEVSVSNFNEALSEGWFTSEVLLATLSEYGKYADILYETVEKTGYSASELMEISDEYTAGSLKNIESYAKGAGMTVEEFSAELNKLGDESLEFSKKAFQSGQIAKTWQDAVNSVKDAVSSGWMRTFEYIFGNFEEAKTLWTKVANELYDVFAESGNERNKILRQWKVEFKGRDKLLEGVGIAWENFVNILNTVKEAFRELFPRKTAEELYSMTESFTNFMQKIKLSDEALIALKAIIKLVLSPFKRISTIVKEAASYFGGLISSIFELNNSFLEALVEGNPFADFLEKIFGTERYNNIARTFKDIIITIANAFYDLSQKVKDAYNNVKKFFSTKKEAEESEGIFSKIVDIFYNLIIGLGNVVKQGIPYIGKLGKALISALSNFLKSMSTIDMSTVFGAFNTGILSIGLAGIKKFLSDFLNGFGQATKNVNGILSSVKETLKAYQAEIKANVIKDIAIAVAILAASLFVLASIKPENLVSGVAAMSALFVEIGIFANSIAKNLSTKQLKSLSTISKSLIAISIAIGILTLSVKALAALDISSLTKGIIGIGAMCLILVKTVNSFSSSSKSFKKSATSLIALGIAIRILASAVEKMGALSLESLAKGLGGVLALCLSIDAFLKLGSFKGVGTKTAIGLIGLATAILILSKAVEKFGNMETSALIAGLSAVSLLIVELGVFTKLTGGSKNMISIGIGMVLLASSIIILSSAVEKFASMSLTDLGKGILGLSGSLLSVALALNLMPKNSLKLGVSLIAVAAAMSIMSKALLSFSDVSWEGLAKGLVAIAGSMAIMAIGLNAVSGTLSGAAALLIVAAAFAILTPQLIALGSMSLTDIGTGLLAIAGVIGIFAVAALLLEPVIPTMIKLAGTLALFGISVLAIGAGVLALSAGLTALGAGGSVAAAGLGLIVTTIISMIPMILEQVGYGIITLAKVLAAGIPAILSAIVEILKAIIEAIRQVVPDLIELIVEIIEKLLDTIADHLPAILNSGIDIIVALLNGIASRIGDIVGVAVTLIIKFIEALADELPKLIKAGIKFIVDFIHGLADALRDGIPDIIEAAVDLAGAIIEGLIKGILDGLSKVVETVWDLCKLIWKGVKSFFGISSPSKLMQEAGGYLDEGLTIGIEKTAKDPKEALIDVGKGMYKGFTSYMQIKSPSLLMKKLGGFVVQGLAEGITSDMSAEQAMAKKAENIVAAFKERLDALSLNANIFQGEYDLWKGMYGDTASSDEAKKQQNIYLTTMLENQAERVRAAEGEYKLMVQEFGEDSENALNSYKKFLDEQIKMTEYASQMADLRNESVSSWAEIAASRAEATRLQYERILQEQGQEAADKWQEETLAFMQQLNEEYGYDDISSFNGPTTVADIFKEFMGDAVNTVEIETTSAIQKGIKNSSSDPNTKEVIKQAGAENGQLYGEEFGKQLNEEVDKQIGNPNDSETAVLNPNSVVAKIDNLANHIAGSDDKIEEATKTGITKPFIGTMRDDFMMNSPSELMRQMGQYIIEGFEIGIAESAQGPVQILRDVIDQMIKALEPYMSSVKIVGTEVINQFQYGIESGIQFAVPELQLALERAFLNTLGVMFYQIGQNLGFAITQGFTEFIYSFMAALGTAITDLSSMASVATNAVRIEFEAAAEAIRSLGEAVATSMAAMLKSIESDAAAAMNTIGNATSQLNDLYQQLSDLSNTGIEIPITLDTSGVQNQISGISGEMSSALANNISRSTSGNGGVSANNNMVVNNYTVNQNNTYNGKTQSEASAYRDTKSAMSSFEAARP